MDIIIDFETYKFGPGNMAPKAVCLSWATDEDRGLLVGEDIPVFLEELLDAEDVRLVGHRMSYDMKVAIQNYPHLTSRIFSAYDVMRIQCTYVREKLLDIALGKKGPRNLYHLGHLAKKHFKVDLDKTTWRTDYDKLDGVPLDKWPEGAVEYAIGDSVITHHLFEHQDMRAKELGYEHFENEAARQACSGLVLDLTSARGLMIDQVQVDLLKSHLTPMIAEAVEEAREYGLFHKQTPRDLLRGKNRKNLKGIRKLIEETYPDPDNIPKTATELTCTDAETISKCNHPGLSAISRLNALTKTDSTYVEVYRKTGELPLHCSYDVLGADTGRTSSWGTNIQNQPRMPGIRECIRARGGWVFVSCDYDAQEIRTLGQACLLLLGRSSMVERFQQDPDFDPHTEFAGRLLHLDYAQALERKQQGDGVLLDFRQRAKAANFGFPGGLGASRFRDYARGYGVDLSEDEAKELRDAWFEQWPEMRDYFNLVSTMAHGSGTVHQLQSGRIRGNCGYTDGANSYFQGLAADASKNALFHVSWECFVDKDTALWGCRPVWFIHDEIGIEAPESYAHEAALRLEEVMVAAMEEVCPDVPARASAALMRRWSKKAKKVTNGDGRLIPWEDAL